MNDIHSYYEIHGQGKPLVLIAGFTCDHTNWSELIQPLAQNHQVLVLDNRGIGRTDSPDVPYTIEMMADDVMRLCEKLKLDQPVVVGQSMGSAITQDIGRRYGNKVDKLILINTFNRLTKLPEVAFEFLAELQRHHLPIRYRVHAIAPWIFSSDFLSRPHQLENLVNLAEENPYPQSIIGYERQLGALKQFDSRDWLHEINNPTLIIASEEDLIAPVSNALDVQSKMGNETWLEMIPGGHGSLVEQPQKIVDTILKFI